MDTPQEKLLIAKNAELEKELAAKKRELETETALEKVRACALVMKEPAHMPAVCRIIAIELDKLGVKEIRNVQTAIFYEEKGTYMNYEYYLKHDRTVITETTYTNHTISQAFADQMLKGKGELFSTHISEAELPDWIAYQKTTNVFIDTYLEKAPSLNYYWDSLGSVALGISTYVPLTEQEIILFKRFRNVFELAYRRYLDIELAIAQAREAQIELALERVRARTMAMQRSDELANVAEILFKQVKSLGIHAWTAGFNIWQEGNDACIDWITSPSGGFIEPYTVDLTSHPFFREISDAKKRGEDFHMFEISGQPLAETYALLMSFAPKQFEGFLASGFQFPTRQINHYVFGAQVGLMFITPEPYPEAHDIFKRFGKVFEQTYTRFLDLQKAEAQAREAKIENALEKVRSRTMAMQRSDELAETASLLFNEITALGINTYRCGFNIWKGNEAAAICWMPKVDGSPRKPFMVRYNEDPFYKNIFDAKQRGEQFFVMESGGKELEETYHYMFTLPGVEKIMKDGIDAEFHFPTFQITHCVFFSTGYLMFIILEPHPEAWDIFKRFAKVFEQTYTRFLDLQKAEAQAREAKIEAALEKVRSRSLAMHKSDELNEVVTILFEKIKELQIPVKAVGIGIYIDGSKDMNTYVCGENEDRLVISNYCLPYFHHKIWKDLNNARDKQLDFFSGSYSKEEKNSFYKYVLEHSALTHLPKDIKSLIFESPAYIISMAPVNHSMFMINDFEGKILSENEVDTIKRFAKVFDQAYTRFLDLQKAEARAREAKIEAALERTRTQSMIMQHSNELDDSLRVFHEQVLLLGINSAFSFLWLPDENKDRHIFWATWAENNSTVFNSKAIDYPLDRKEPATAQCLVDWKSNEPIVSYHVPSSGVESYFAAWQELFDGVEQLKPEYFSAGLYYVEAFMKYGCFGVMVATDLREDEKKILGRFAIEFERTYTRFLDLQKAEEQAREAKIELGLERVRARTMAMQKSDELNELIKILLGELTDLEISLDRCLIMTYDPQTLGSTWWMASRDDFSYKTGLLVPYHTNPPQLAYIKGWQERQKKWTYLLEGNEKKEWDEFLFSHTALSKLPDEVIAGMKNIEKNFSSASFKSFGCLTTGSFEPLTDEAFDILIRFTKVFDQAYTRFLDLQKSEAQAKEAQIQLAMERVRARTMAMQHSNELPDAANILFQQVQSLGMPAWSAGYCIWDDDKKAITLWMSSAGIIQQPFKASLTEDPSFIHFFEAYQRGETFYTEEIGEDELVSHYQYIRKLPVVGDMLNKFVEEGGSLPVFQIFHLAFFSQGFLLFITYEQVSEAHDIFKRFGKVFDQTYTRFLDLQKAEAQARESQIQLALERVRARTMAMQKSDELGETVFILFQQFKQLGENPDQATIGIINEDEWVIEYWVTMYGNQNNKVYRFSIDEPNVTNQIYKGWKEQKKSLVIELTGKELYDFATFRESMGGAAYNEKEKKRVINVAFFSKGIINVQSNESRSAESIRLLERFAAVFEQTYTRFLDLQKAEAQAREAQVETALERVRSRTMAMQKSEELAETAVVVFQQLISLGIEPNRLYIGIINDESGDLEFWMTDEKGQQVTNRYVVNIHQNISIKKMYEGWKEQRQTLSIDMSGNELHEWITYWNKEFGVPFMLGAGHQRRVQNLACFSKGFIAMTTFEIAPKETVSLLNRFAAVFNLTYTRFNDLQLAEAQVREAQIQLALERVRAKTMAMHNSEDVTSATETMFEELQKLDINNLRGGIANIHPEKTMEVFGITNMTDGKTMRGFTLFDVNAHPIWQRLFESWNNKEEVFIDYLTGAEKEDYFNVVNSHQNYLPRSIGEFPDTHFQSYRFDQGNIWTFSLQPHSDTDREIMKRFASVFALTFRRYQDLKKAEAQAREAQIEASLERVRAKAMAMQNSNDLSIAASMVFTELRKLGINPIRCGVGLFNKESRKAQLYFATSSSDGDSLSAVGWVMMSQHPVLKNIYDAWLRHEDIFPELSGEQLKSYYENLFAELSLPAIPHFEKEEKQFGHFFSFSVGYLSAWSDKHYTESEIKILKRFASIIDLTFRRYLELQTSEANTREAVKQSALDRIRADIASMRTVNDLDRITPLIWNELTILGIPFIRCGVFIMNDEQQLIYTFLSTPDGKAIAAFHIPYDTPGNIEHVISHWHNNKNYIDHWDENAFTEFAKMLITQGALISSQQYLKTIPHGGFYLHFLPFLQGMLYVGNTKQLSEDEIKLIQSVADAFSTAYARYEDFNKLEAAKQQVDKTLVHLKQTQAQLIQSEKMASLGELTAGIAHEIQNPLNFVNNFSEVSTELLDEMITELENGHKEDAIAIADDVKQNLEKILHHGKRADGIVKGMLQHSRSSSATKEPTDINKLADEYLRLAYHGLRAKDKSFNATMITGYDETIGNINIIPQDIGRVILNLIMNAFYTTAEKKKQNIEGYEPTVSVSTKKAGGNVQVSVKDNGSGIPQKVADKIFQPFFTTKPTGQGTGLGLSLSYDIIKAHGGEIKVETKEGEGSEFIITLPLN